MLAAAPASFDIYISFELSALKRMGDERSKLNLFKFLNNNKNCKSVLLVLPFNSLLIVYTRSVQRPAPCVLTFTIGLTGAHYVCLPTSIFSVEICGIFSIINFHLLHQSDAHLCSIASYCHPTPLLYMVSFCKNKDDKLG